MDKIQSFDSQFQKSFFKELHNPSQIKREESELDLNCSHIPPNLSLDHNPHSLALGVRNSIENVIPIPRNMLSHSDEPELGANEQQGDKDQIQMDRVKVEVGQQDKAWFVEELGLNELLYLKKFPSNTKNVLRNFGNAQNQYILYHKDAIDYANQKLAVPQRFFKWVRGLKLQKFEDFRDIWSANGLQLNPVFRRVYRQLCFKFYQQCAVPYVLASRMKCNDTKLSHLRYIYRFLQGIKNPNDFTYFKKVQR